MRLGCHYPHAWHFAHTHSLIDYRPHTTDPKLIDMGLALVESGWTVSAAAVKVGVKDAALRRIAHKAGLVKPVGRYQRTINSTNLRVIYLKLRLASLSKKDAAAATGISYRQALFFEKGQQGRGQFRHAH